MTSRSKVVEILTVGYSEYENEREDFEKAVELISQLKKGVFEYRNALDKKCADKIIEQLGLDKKHINGECGCNGDHDCYYKQYRDGKLGVKSFLEKTNPDY